MVIIIWSVLELIKKIKKWLKHRRDKKLNKSIKIVYDQVDKFLAYGDTIQRTGIIQEGEPIMMRSPITLERRDTDNWRNAPISETFDPEVINRAYESNTLPLILGSPNDSIEFLDSPGAEVNERGYRNQLTPEQIEAIENDIRPSITTIMERQRQASEIILREAQQSIEPELLEIWQKELIEYLKEDLSAHLGIPISQLFSPPGDRGSVILRARGVGRSAMASRLVNDPIFQFIWNNPATKEPEEWDINEMIQNPHPEPPAPPGQARHDYIDAITSSLRAFENAKVVWSGSIKHTPEDIAKIEKIYKAKQKREAMKRAFDRYINDKASNIKRLQMCYSEDCNQNLKFNDFVATNSPKNFLEYYRLKKIWLSPYVRLFCCSCFQIIESKTYEETEEDGVLYNNE